MFYSFVFKVNFKRPIVIFGPLADVSREKLKTDYVDKYEIPESYSNPDDVLQQNDSCGGNGGVIKVASIKNIIQKVCYKELYSVH
jgi:hypothetical protein